MISMIRFSATLTGVALLYGAAFAPNNIASAEGSGDLEQGRLKAVICAGCHGVNGEGMTMPPGVPSYPRLAGQIPAYFVKALTDYKTDVRVDPMMSASAKGLSEADIANLAAYYASLK